jgi:hypothetical protein
LSAGGLRVGQEGEQIALNKALKGGKVKPQCGVTMQPFLHIYHYVGVTKEE